MATTVTYTTGVIAAVIITTIAATITTVLTIAQAIKITILVMVEPGEKTMITTTVQGSISKAAIIQDTTADVSTLEENQAKTQVLAIILSLNSRDCESIAKSAQ